MKLDVKFFDNEITSAEQFVLSSQKQLSEAVGGLNVLRQLRNLAAKEEAESSDAEIESDAVS